MSASFTWMLACGLLLAGTYEGHAQSRLRRPGLPAVAPQQAATPPASSPRTTPAQPGQPRAGANCPEGNSEPPPAPGQFQLILQAAGFALESRGPGGTPCVRGLALRLASVTSPARMIVGALQVGTDGFQMVDVQMAMKPDDAGELLPQTPWICGRSARSLDLPPETAGVMQLTAVIVAPVPAATSRCPAPTPAPTAAPATKPPPAAPGMRSPTPAPAMAPVGRITLTIRPLDGRAAAIGQLQLADRTFAVLATLLPGQPPSPETR